MLEVVCGRSSGGGGAGKRFQSALRVAASASIVAALTAFIIPAVRPDRPEDELNALRAACFDSGLDEAFLMMLVRGTLRVAAGSHRSVVRLSWCFFLGGVVGGSLSLLRARALSLPLSLSLSLS